MTPRNESTIIIDDEPAKSPATAPTTVIVEEEPGAGAVVVDEDAALGGELPARAIRNPNGTITLPLRKPVTLTIRNSRGGERAETYEELILRDLTGADFRAIQAASPAAQGVVTLARATGIREAVMNALYDRMTGADIVDAAACAMSFLPDGAKAKART